VDLQAGNGLAELWLPAVIQIPMAGNDIIVSAAAIGPSQLIVVCCDVYFCLVKAC
jgi:hypothetical protein